MQQRQHSHYFFLVPLLLLAGCLAENSLEPPNAPQTRFLATSEARDLGYGAGAWAWTWHSLEGRASGRAFLEIRLHPRGLFLRWAFSPLPTEGEWILRPEDTARWHTWRGSSGDGVFPWPLPRVAVDSAHYPHLLAFVQDLTRERFDAVVTHWPAKVVPLRLFPAVNDSLDLSAILQEAMDIWNDGPGGPFFRADSLATWGVRLVHFPDRSLRPPAGARITRLDAAGRPLRVHIEVGNDYNQPWDRRPALRAMVHELGHGLLLWGHSLERDHCLWGAAPPLVSAPSLDERKAARWWRGLPQGLDLKQYGD